jgi:hypothetical protein
MASQPSMPYQLKNKLMTMMLKRKYGKTNSGNRETVRLQKRHK